MMVKEENEKQINEKQINEKVKTKGAEAKLKP